MARGPAVANENRIWAHAESRAAEAARGYGAVAKVLIG